MTMVAVRCKIGIDITMPYHRVEDPSGAVCRKDMRNVRKAAASGGGSVAIRQCANHHYFDDEKFKVCPICLMAQQQGAEPADETVGYTIPLSDDEDLTVGYGMVEGDRMTKPTVGWLVCVGGSERGRDWRLHEGRNDVGTTADADVLLAEKDAQKRWYCSVIYDGKHREFLVIPGTGALVYHNGVLLTGPEPLQDGDEIGIGVEEVLLCFQSFCRKEKAYW